MIPEMIEFERDMRENETLGDMFNKAYDNVMDIVDKHQKQSTLEDTLSQREETHGKFTTQALLSQSMKRWARTGKNWDVLDADMKESIDMILHKVARILNGDQYHIDSWHDISGYATLVENRLNGH